MVLTVHGKPEGRSTCDDAKYICDDGSRTGAGITCFYRLALENISEENLALVLEVLESRSEVNLNKLRVCLKRVGVGECFGGRSQRV